MARRPKGNYRNYFLSFLQLDGTELFHFVDGYPSWDAYLSSMMADGTWGDHVILHGAANCFQTCIHVISSLPHRHDVMICPEFDVTGSNRLVLGHLHELHYVSLIPQIGGKDVWLYCDSRITTLQTFEWNKWLNHYCGTVFEDAGQKQDVYFFTCTVFNPPIFLWRYD